MSDTTAYAASLRDVRAAVERIAPYAHRTPVATCRTIDALAGRQVFFKCENLQKVGAFKFRGACNAVMHLSDEAAGRGVVTHSSGNHAQALALAAKLRGISADIVMPETALAVKRAAVVGYGGRVHLCQEGLHNREDAADAVLAETGGTLISPFEHPDVIAGQGTAALELIERVPDLDAIIAPIGGGGLMSGTCIAASGAKPGIRLFGAEPAGADDAARSLASGTFVPQTGPCTIADGLLTSLGEHTTWPVIRDHVERIFTVSETEIVEAMKLVWQRVKMVIEPSAAVPVAAVLGDELRGLDGVSRIGVILSGGNADLDHVPW